MRALILSLVFIALPASAFELYINPLGNDSWSGTLREQNSAGNDGPIKTPEKAKEIIRSLKKSQKIKEPIYVNIAHGIYYLDHPLRFDSADSGSPTQTITWQAELGAEVTLSGGIPIECHPGENGIWTCTLQKKPINSEPIDTNRAKGTSPLFDLYVNEKRMTLARWPNQEWAHIKNPLVQKTSFTTMETLPAMNENIADTQIHIFPGNDWFDQYLGVALINQASNTIQTSGPAQYDLQPGRRFYLLNQRSFLDAASEWLYDKQTREISFIPTNLEPIQTITVSSLPNVVIADGLSYVNFSRLKFKHSAGSGLIFRSSTKIQLDSLEIAGTGGNGLEVRGGNNVTLSNSSVYDTGKHGAIMTGGNRNTLQPSGHILHNNHIHHVGVSILTYSGAIYVDGVGSVVTHNLVEFGNGSAILVAGNEHLIEKNEVRQFCLLSSDCGAIYTGRDWAGRGNTIRNNYIHEIPGYGLKGTDVSTNQVIYQSPDYAMGIYLDDGASGFHVNGNILKNIGGVSFYIHGGRDNNFYNNYIITDHSAIKISKILTPNYDWNKNQDRLNKVPYQSEIWRKKYPELTKPGINMFWPEGNTVEGNVIISNSIDTPSLIYWIPGSSTTIRNNLVWSTSNQIILDYNITEQNVRHQTASWQQWIAEGVEKNSLFINPCIDLIGKSLIACKDSPIFDKHIPLPQSDIGLNR